MIIDQTKLPSRTEYLTLRTPKDLYDAIFELKVRGAPAIGICAGFGIYILARTIDAKDYEGFYQQFCEYQNYLDSARPTAVNLSWALNRMEQTVVKNRQLPVPEILEKLEQECMAIQEEDMDMCRKISEHGLSLLKNGDGILTHCNAGHLAVSEYGTALAPVYLGEERGYGFKVFADETRPLLQGARLTAYELNRAGVDVTLICDNMASSVMQKGWVQAVIVGCDRIAANGDIANKIGTSGVAILARHYGIPFYVLGPTSTIDMQCPDGKSIVIEERDPAEVTEMWYMHRMAPKDVKIFNPAFDVTPNELITAIITEKGIFNPANGGFES